MASAPVLREGELVGAFYLDYAHEEIVGDARRLAWGVAVVAAFWIMVGLPLAQLSLDFGTDDLDGTVVEEKITHMAGATTEEYISKEELVKIIKEAGRTPVERDTLYNTIRVYE